MQTFSPHIEKVSMSGAYIFDIKLCSALGSYHKSIFQGLEHFFTEKEGHRGYALNLR